MVSKLEPGRTIDGRDHHWAPLAHHKSTPALRPVAETRSLDRDVRGRLDNLLHRGF